MNDRILILSFVEWSGAFQRPQHLALGLARRGCEVSYVFPGYVHRRQTAAAAGIDLPATLEIVAPRALPGGSRWRGVAWLNQLAMNRTVCRRSGSVAWDAVIFNDPRWAALAAMLPSRNRIFDCMDDLSAMAPSRQWARKQELHALHVADRFWTGTASLEERLKGESATQGKSIRFIPCGVDYDHFSRPDPATIESMRSEIPAGDGPLAGYFGVLNERVRGDLLEALLEGGARVLLIGPATSRAPRLITGREHHPRLRWVGARPYQELPAWLAWFDLAIIPYDAAGPHRYLYPVKALEYLAGGKPVVSTPLPDVIRFLGDYVETADTAAEWRRVLRRLSAEPDLARARAELGKAYARRRSWEAMVDDMLADLAGGGA